MNYYFYVKKDVDYKKYGFVEDNKEWIVWRGTRRITIKKANMSVSFNMITNEILKIFSDMVRDGVITCSQVITTPRRYHYIGLDDEEYKLIQKRRNEKEQKDLVFDYEFDPRQLGIEELDLSVRTFNCLRRAGLKTAGEICKHTELEIYKIRNLGKRCLKEIKEKLALYGLELKNE